MTIATASLYNRMHDIVYMHVRQLLLLNQNIVYTMQYTQSHNLPLRDQAQYHQF